MYLGPAVGPLRSLVLDALEQEQPLEQLKDSLSALDIARKGAKEPRELGQRLLDGAQHAVLVVPGAASRHGLVPPTAEAEAAALGELVVAAPRARGSSGAMVITFDMPLLDGDLMLITAPTARTLLTRVESRLGRRIVPPEPSRDTAASAPAGPEEEQRQDSSSSNEGLSSGAADFIRSVLQRAAALEGRQLSDLPPRAQADLAQMAARLIAQRLRSGETSAVPVEPGSYSITVQATADDMAQLQAAIRALRLPPAAGVLRCAACGASDDPPFRRLRRCAACRQA